VRSKKVRFMSLFVVLAAALVVSGFIAPGASAEVAYVATFTVNPSNALKNQVITSDPLNTAGDKVQVQVTSPYEYSTAGLTVTLEFVTGTGFASTGSITGNVENTNVDGYATFSNLKINDTNEATLTDYEFEAVVSGGGPTSEPPPIGAVFASEGAFSDPFDIWDAGCASPCTATLKNNSQSYRATDGDLFLSALASSDLPNLECPGQTLIFSQDIFTHATSGTAPVFLTSKVSKLEMKRASNNGQAFVKWCIGLKEPDDWDFNGASYTQQDTDGDGTDDLYVAFAPKCPKTNQAAFAPCIVKQKADPAGGNVTTGWLPGGDPPRRT
jgi:FlaG/FlaF family flagellin (archaellin)